MPTGVPEGHSLPWTSPAYGPPPFEMTDCRPVLVQFEADPNEIASFIPPPFELPERPFACAFVGDMRQVPGPGRYHEGEVTGRSALSRPQVARSGPRPKRLAQPPA